MTKLGIYRYIRLKSLHNTKGITKVVTNNNCFNMTEFSSHQENLSMPNFDLY